MLLYWGNKKLNDIIPFYNAHHKFPLPIPWNNVCYTQNFMVCIYMYCIEITLINILQLLMRSSSLLWSLSAGVVGEVKWVWHQDIRLVCREQRSASKWVDWSSSISSSRSSPCQSSTILWHSTNVTFTNVSITASTELASKSCNHFRHCNFTSSPKLIRVFKFGWASKIIMLLNNVNEIIWVFKFTCLTRTLSEFITPPPSPAPAPPPSFFFYFFSYLKTVQWW